jgi:transcriptional regulator with PAS, ATPase and Fis domain
MGHDRVAPLETMICLQGESGTGDLALATSCATPPDISNLGRLEQRAIERAIREADGNRSRAARQLGVSRTQLCGRLRKYGFDGIGR